MKLSPNKISLELQRLEGWKLTGGEIVKEFKFANFPTAVLFVNKLVDPAEEISLHPSVTINYNRVTISIFNHMAGGITDKDFILARRIDELV